MRAKGTQNGILLWNGDIDRGGSGTFEVVRPESGCGMGNKFDDNNDSLKITNYLTSTVTKSMIVSTILVDMKKHKTVQSFL